MLILRAGRDKCTHLRRAKCGFVNSPRITDNTHSPADHPLKHQATGHTAQHPVRHLLGRSQAASPHIGSREKARYSLNNRTAASQLLQQPPPTPSTSLLVFDWPLRVHRCAGRVHPTAGLLGPGDLPVNPPAGIFLHGTIILSFAPTARLVFSCTGQL